MSESNHHPLTASGATGRDLVPIHETATAAAAAQAKAEVEAAYVIAAHHPRDWMQVRERLLRECERPRFCEGAKYSLPRRSFDRDTRQWVTSEIVGPTVRFAEAALRAMTNVRVSLVVLYDDAEKRVCRLTVVDLEVNTPNSAEFVVAKTVERRALRKGETALRERVGSDGDTVYVCATSESDVAQKQNAAAAKARRNLILQAMPGDIMEEALDRVDAVLLDDHAKDPEAAARKLLDGFRRLGVQAADIAEYLGHSADRITPSEFTALRDLGVAIRDGQTTWADAMETRQDAEADGAASAPMSGDELAERAELIRYLATARIERGALLARALAASELDPTVMLETLRTEQLAELASYIETPPQNE
jgi:cellobiose-specific phosphotransferase system component IIB